MSLRRPIAATAIAISAGPVLIIVAVGDLAVAWSFSAFTVLLYYGITNLSALALDRRRWTAWLGLVSCAFLSFYVPLSVWVVGAALVSLGLVWQARRRD